MNFTHDKALLIWPLFNHKIHETQSTWGHTSNFIPTGPVIWHLTGRVWHVYWGRVKKLNMSGSQAINLIHLLQQKICHDRQAVNCIYIAHLILFWFLSSLSLFILKMCVFVFSKLLQIVSSLSLWVYTCHLALFRDGMMRKFKI